jgi:hypothetical protein
MEPVGDTFDENGSDPKEHLEDTTICGNQDSLLDNDVTAEATRHLQFNVAPSEGLSPVSLFTDKFAEELSYPSIFGGHYRCTNASRSRAVTYKDIVKSELRNIDRRSATNISNLFFKFKKLQLQDLTSCSALRMQKGKNAHNFCVSDVNQPEKLNEIVNTDLGYRFFQKVRGTPDYWEHCKKDLFVMLRQLGMPTFFITVSMADTKWKKLRGNLVHLKTGLNGDALEAAVDRLSYKEKVTLIKEDPETCALL